MPGEVAKPVNTAQLNATVQVPSQPPVAWYKPMGEAAGAIVAILGLVGYMAWVIAKIINADRDIKEVKHDLRNAESKISALDLKREDAAKELAVLKNTTSNLEAAMAEVKGLMQQVLAAVTERRR